MCKGVMVVRGSAEAGASPREPLKDRPSPTTAIRRGLVAMALCWQALVMGPDPSFWPTAQPGSWLSVALILAGALWLMMTVDFLVRRLPDPLRVAAYLADALLIIGSGLGLMVQTASSGRLQEAWAPGATLVILGVGVAGMLLQAKVAWSLIAVTVSVEAVVAFSAGPLSPDSFRDALLYPMYALAVGAASAGARRSLLRVARRHEEALVQVREARVRSAAISRIRRELSRQERLIHESVLNTLAAIGSGGLRADSPSIRKEAAASAEVLLALSRPSLSSLDSPAGTWNQDLRMPLERLQARGIATRLEVSARLEAAGHPGMSPDAYAGMLVAIRESLSNVERHAGAEQVIVRIAESSGLGGSGWVQATISDDGAGFDPVPDSFGFGISESIFRTMSDVGGTAALESKPGRGTVVSLGAPSRGLSRRSRWVEWLLDGQEGASNLPAEMIPMGRAAFARPVLAWFGAFVLASVIVTGVLVTSPALTLIAVAIVVGLGVGVWVLSTRPHLPAWFLLLCAVTAPIAYRLQAQSIGGEWVSHWEDWTSEALAAIWLVCTAVGPWWSVLVALTSWLLTQGDPLNELTQPGTAIIVAGAVFARSVRRNNRAFVEAERERTEELAAVLVESEGLERMRSRHELLEDSLALNLLMGVADGRLDPGAPQVQQGCVREERFIRAVMRLDPRADLVQRQAAQAALRAHRLGVSLEVSLADTEAWPEPSCGRFFAEVQRMLDTGEIGTVARLTARQEGDALVMRFVSGDGMEVLEVRHA